MESSRPKRGTAAGLFLADDDFVRVLKRVLVQFEDGLDGGGGAALLLGDATEKVAFLDRVPDFA